MKSPKHKQMRTRASDTTNVEIHLPHKTITLLKKEFKLKENEVEKFINSMISKMIEEHVGERNAKVFSKDETKEIEDDLKGLGYI